MGLVSSYISKKKENNIKTLEILNQSINNIRLLKKEEQRLLGNLQNKKNKILIDIKEEKTRFEILQKRHHQTIETIKLFECKICMDNLNKIMCIPCGHCFCLSCSENLKQCPICRSQIQSVNNIYFN